MEQVRKPFQGVLNIIKFNWHFYLLSVFVLCGFLVLSFGFKNNFLFILLFFLTLSGTLSSILVSFYVYDYSDLYKLNWLPDNNEKISIANINAGFDETSSLLQLKYKNANLIVLDFYNPATHTEISIKRARKAYPAFANTRAISTANTGLSTHSVDKIFVTFAAHEIRNDAERVIFFNELGKILKPNGQVYVTEHLRDFSNFLAYNIGFFHFLSNSTWHKTFESSTLKIKCLKKITPFLTSYTLEQHGDPT